MEKQHSKNTLARANAHTHKSLFRSLYKSINEFEVHNYVIIVKISLDDGIFDVRTLVSIATTQKNASKLLNQETDINQTW